MSAYLVTIADKVVRFCVGCNRQTYIFITRDQPMVEWCCACQRRIRERRHPWPESE